MGGNFESSSVFSDDMKKPARAGRPTKTRATHEKKAEGLDDLFGKDDPDVPKEKRGGRMKISPY